MLFSAARLVMISDFERRDADLMEISTAFSSFTFTVNLLASLSTRNPH